MEETKTFYVDWSMNILEGKLVYEAEASSEGPSKVAIARGRNIEVLPSDRVFNCERDAILFAVRELTGQYQNISNVSNKLMERLQLLM